MKYEAHNWATTYDPHCNWEVRQAFAETMNRVAYGRERIVLHRRGKDLAALIPAEDLTLLEALEDRLDAQEAEKALAKSKARGEKPIPWEKAKKKLGL
jgi:prevent-host-death family protein